MFNEISDVIEAHLGFVPLAFVLILTDGKQAQTMFFGENANDMTRLLAEGLDRHQRVRRQQ